MFVGLPIKIGNFLFSIPFVPDSHLVRLVLSRV